MHNSNFSYLENEFPILFNIGSAAEYYLHADPAVSMGKMRMLGEKITEIIFEKHYLDFPRENSFHNRLKVLDQEIHIPTRVKDLFFLIKEKGNQAVHSGKGNLKEAQNLLEASFKVTKWFYESYSDEQIDISAITYAEPPNLDARNALSVLENEFKQLEQKFAQLLNERKIGNLPEKVATTFHNRSEKAAKKIEMSEAETRGLIDEQLRAAGWEVNTALLNYKTQKTLPEKGRNIAIAEWPIGTKWADYALFVGTELYGIVEAKKYATDISTDLTQSKVYSELAEEKFDAELLGQWQKYKVPFLFSTNGRPYLEQIKTKSGIWFLDVRKERNRARSLKGWYSPKGLLDLYAQDLDEAAEKLKSREVDYLTHKDGLNLRPYQIKAIKAVEEKVSSDFDRPRALLAMATGTGKTRTILGLCYRLISTNRFKRILFLVDRNLLAIQTFNTFKDTKIEDANSFISTYHVSDLKDRIPDFESRLHFATVQGMVKRLFYEQEGQPVLPVDTYDCIIVDEAHRGYLQDREMDDEELNFKDQKDYVSKYRLVLDYFDAFGIGLTATPALHTTEIFGKPVYTYSYREAVIDGFLVDHEPPYLIKTKLGEEGIVWLKGEKPKIYDREKNEVVELDELEDELNIDISAFNKSVITEPFNRTVVKQLVNELDPEGEKKTLIFAATDEHADLVVDLLKEEFANAGIDLNDEAIKKITGKVYKPEELVKRFKNEKYPNIVVTVDLLTTGVDVPPICNLVFLRRVRSRILFEQMLGRATRKCNEIGKEFFRIYDAVKIYDTLQDFTTMKPVSPNPKTTFTQLMEEVDEIDSKARLKKQLDQIIAKYQRKKRHISEKEEQFSYLTKGQNAEQFADYLKSIPEKEIKSKIKEFQSVWSFLDELKPAPSHQLFSEHVDEYLRTERGYGNAKKPEDYLNGLKNFIQENMNKITALQIICTRPKDLDRQSLKELKIILDQQGYNTRTLDTAWKATKNEDIAADIVSYIRTLALGSSLISHDERIKRAIVKVKKLNNWNQTQLNWIDRFEKQLMQEDILQAVNLNEEPFNQDGGFERLDKIFGHRLGEVIDTINNNLYNETA
jgi:type I restriction enzyme R subunit